VVVALVIEYTPNYPEELPIISVEPIKGVSDSEADCLLEILNQLAEENLGNQMVFSLASRVKEWGAEMQDASLESQIIFEGAPTAGSDEKVCDL
jgi:hypothetical protein